MLGYVALMRWWSLGAFPPAAQITKRTVPEQGMVEYKVDHPRLILLTAVPLLPASCGEGPLALLKRCYAQRRPVQVYTRHRRGLRGTATGFLKAFDKFCNLVRRSHHSQNTAPGLLHLKRGCGPLWAVCCFPLVGSSKPLELQKYSSVARTCFKIPRAPSPPSVASRLLTIGALYAQVLQDVEESYSGTRLSRLIFLMQKNRTPSL